ncbi:MAG: hypothetical protein HAW59_06745, partial [Betaproteobacteria bacterium]|nr:hypothetical protein [Betaproteobacteria bacterium]
MRLQSAAAKIINARQTAEMRRRMRAHAGCVVAVQAGALRFCFRIDAGGRWRAAFPQTAADAEIRFGGGGLQLNGGGELLRDLDAMRQQNGLRQIFADVFGGAAADFFADAAARLDIKNCLVKSGVAAAPAAVSEFNQKAAA